MIIKHPLSTEKAIRLMESENKLVFIVDNKANKQEIKKAIEERFDVKVVQVRTINDPKGRKKAYVKFSAETPAIDLATRLGLM
ncbi:MAG TPA: 50S ribosomal protein L23 [Candidatus Woesearchaeota archaeon]|nr:50S ribosomal protein L23 [Candidatus Woesearchaeota archaeon]